MPTIPPWLHSPDFVGAMQAGASTGLAVRRQADEEDQAADRLSLAYNQLAQQERQQNQAAKAKLDLAHATMALRSQQLDATRAYHQGTLDAQEAARQLREQNMQRLSDEFQQREGRLGKESADLGPPQTIDLPNQPGYFATKSATGKGYTIHPKRPSLEDVKAMSPATAAQLAAKLPELAGTFGTNWVNEVTPEIQKRIGEGLKPKTKGAGPGKFKFDSKIGGIVPINEPVKEP